MKIGTKNATPLPIHVESEVREEVEPVLGESAARREARYRTVRTGFLACGGASLDKARESGKTVSTKSVIARLDKIIDDNFGPGSARKKMNGA